MIIHKSFNLSDEFYFNNYLIQKKFNLNVFVHLLLFIILLSNENPLYFNQKRDDLFYNLFNS